MANMMKMMKQAADMQKNMQKMQAEMQELLFRPKISKRTKGLADGYWKRNGMGKMSIYDRC